MQITIIILLVVSLSSIATIFFTSDELAENILAIIAIFTITLSLIFFVSYTEPNFDRAQAKRHLVCVIEGIEKVKDKEDYIKLVDLCESRSKR